ncbi:MAG TPA: hypothetical protein DHV59_14160 [Oxalobacteraceae bacterium]|nr:hypothetical protein [Oxalobacteraceae bacterium]
MPTLTAPLIDAAHVLFMQSGVSMSIGGCDVGNNPWLSKAIGCRVAPDFCTVTVFAAASHSPELIAAIRQTGRISAVFSQPSTHRTLQLKGKDARIAAAEAGDQAIVAAYRDAFVRELLPLGFDEGPIYAFLDCDAGDILRISFSPCAAFTQTPGPHAGQPLQPRA